MAFNLCLNEFVLLERTILAGREFFLLLFFSKKLANIDFQIIHEEISQIVRQCRETSIPSVCDWAAVAHRIAPEITLYCDI